jgi:hypothetical protein
MAMVSLSSSIANRGQRNCCSTKAASVSRFLQMKPQAWAISPIRTTNPRRRDSLLEWAEFERTADFASGREPMSKRYNWSVPTVRVHLAPRGSPHKPRQSSRPGALGARSAVKPFTASRGGAVVLYCSLIGSFFFVAAFCAAGRQRLVRNGWHGLECPHPICCLTSRA